jgi:drug/metabolite transporter (DMT)-like permease
MRLRSSLRSFASPGAPVLERQALGMTLALLAYSTLALQDATVKWLVATVPVWLVLFARSAILVAGCLGAGGRPLLRHAATTPTRSLLVRRGAVTLAAWVCYFSAARYLPLGQLVTLYFTAPVIVTLLAAPLLGEQVGWVRWTAVGLGFFGTVLAANPAGLSLSPATLLVLVAAVLWGYGVILTRQIARLERSLVQMFFNNCFFLVLTGIACAVSWHQLTADEMWLLLLVGVLGGFGQFCLFESAQHAPASLTAPLEYTALVWAFILGFLVWGDSPRPGVFIGAGLILSAGLLLLMMDERIRNSAFRYRWVGRAGWRQARPVRAGLAEGPATQATPVSRTKKTVIEGRAP